MQTPEQFTDDLKAALGSNLQTVAIYGSAATGNRTPKFSDTNLMIIVEKADTAVLSSMSSLVSGWVKGGNKPPIIVVRSELRRSQDVFPVELSDIRERHRLLFGDGAALGDIEVRPADLRRQLEFELRSKILLLRQAFVDSASRRGALDDLMAKSLSSISALFRGVLRLVGERAPSSTPEVLRLLETKVSIDAEAWEIVWRLRHGDRLPRGFSSEQVFNRLLAGLLNAVNFVDAFTAS